MHKDDLIIIRLTGDKNVCKNLGILALSNLKIPTGMTNFCLFISYSKSFAIC